MRCSIAPPFLQPAAVLYRPSSCICRYCHVCLKWAIPYPVRLLSLDILGYDFVQCAVVLQGLKSAVDFLQQLCVALLYSNGILFIGKGLLQNLQSFCLSNKGLGRLSVDYNRVNLALAQCLSPCCNALPWFRQLPGQIHRYHLWFPAARLRLHPLSHQERQSRCPL